MWVIVYIVGQHHTYTQSVPQGRHGHNKQTIITTLAHVAAAKECLQSRHEVQKLVNSCTASKRGTSNGTTLSALKSPETRQAPGTGRTLASCRDGSTSAF